MPKNFESYFYFKIGGNVIEEEQKFVAWDVVQRKKVDSNDQPQDMEEDKEEGQDDASMIDIENN